MRYEYHHKKDTNMTESRTERTYTVRVTTRLPAGRRWSKRAVEFSGVSHDALFEACNLGCIELGIIHGIKKFSVTQNGIVKMEIQAEKYTVTITREK